MNQQLCTESARALIAAFYDALNQPAQKNIAALIHSVASPDWRSYAGESISKGREEFILQAQGFGRAIPDLAWNVKDVLVCGNRIVVRSEATGTPAGDFLGAPHTGRSFKIMTIDIHTVQDGKLQMAHHVEDWALALRQLAGK